MRTVLARLALPAAIIFGAGTAAAVPVMAAVAPVALVTASAHAPAAHTNMHYG